MNGSMLKAWRKLEKAIKYVVTAKRKRSFWCDSKPWLCIACIRLRCIITKGKLPNFIILNTKMGKFIHHAKGLQVTVLRGMS